MSNNSSYISNTASSTPQNLAVHNFFFDNCSINKDTLNPLHTHKKRDHIPQFSQFPSTSKERMFSFCSFVEWKWNIKFGQFFLVKRYGFCKKSTTFGSWVASPSLPGALLWMAITFQLPGGPKAGSVFRYRVQREGSYLYKWESFYQTLVWDLLMCKVASISPMRDFLNWRFQILPPKSWVRWYYHYPLQDLMQLRLVSTHYVALNFLLPPTKYWDHRSAS